VKRDIQLLHNHTILHARSALTSRSTVARSSAGREGRIKITGGIRRTRRRGRPTSSCDVQPYVETRAKPKPGRAFRRGSNLEDRAAMPLLPYRPDRPHRRRANQIDIRLRPRRLSALLDIATSAFHLRARPSRPTAGGRRDLIGQHRREPPGTCDAFGRSERSARSGRQSFVSFKTATRAHPRAPGRRLARGEPPPNRARQGVGGPASREQISVSITREIAGARAVK
jgi:hypothetical protein